MGTSSYKHQGDDPLVPKPRSLGQPRFDSGATVLSFPLFQRLVIATLGFDDFTGVRFFIDLHLACLTAGSFGLDGWCATACFRIQQVDHFRQAVTIFGGQGAQLIFEFDFFLEASIVFQGFESLDLFSEVFFELAELCELGQGQSLFD